MLNRSQIMFQALSLDLTGLALCAQSNTVTTLSGGSNKGSIFSVWHIHISDDLMGLLNEEDMYRQNVILKRSVSYQSVHL